VRDHGIEVNAIAPWALTMRMLDEVLNAGPDAVDQRESLRRALSRSSLENESTG
jgi:hypothetical protein